MGTRRDDFCLVEFVAERVEGSVGNEVGLTVDLEEEFVAGGVGSPVHAGGKKRAHEAAASSWRLRVSRTSWTRAVSNAHRCLSIGHAALALAAGRAGLLRLLASGTLPENTQRTITFFRAAWPGWLYASCWQHPKFPPMAGTLVPASSLCSARSSRSWVSLWPCCGFATRKNPAAPSSCSFLHARCTLTKENPKGPRYLALRRERVGYQLAGEKPERFQVLRRMLEYRQLSGEYHPVASRSWKARSPVVAVLLLGKIGRGT